MDSSNRSNLIKVGKYIAKLRKEKGYTQKALGELLDVSDKTISKWERGDIAPDITILHALAKELNSSVDDILCGEEHKEESISDENSIKMIQMYSDQTKRKLLKEILIGLTVIALAAVFIFYVDNYQRWHVTRLKSDGEIVLRGYLIGNNSESKIIIDKIILNSREMISEEELSLESYEIKIYNKKKIIYSKLMSDIDNVYIEKLFENTKIIADNLPKIKTNNLKIEIIVITVDGDEKVFKIEF